MTVGDRIRKARLEQGMTQQELADYIGVSKQAVYKYETNIVTNIPTDKIDAIARRLRVAPSYLMGWEEQPNPKESENADALELSPEEIELIKKYRKTSKKNKNVVLTLLEDD